MTRPEALRQYWADVRAGRREPPKRKTDGTVTRTQIDARIAELNRPEPRAERPPPAENGGQ